MSARSKRLGQIERDTRDAKASTERLDGRKMLADIEYLLGWISTEVEPKPGPTSEPRVWCAARIYALHWWWQPNDESWGGEPNALLRNRDIFVAGCHPRPSTAPSSDLASCRKVDW